MCVLCIANIGMNKVASNYSLRPDDRYYDRGGRGPPPGRSRGFGHGWSDRDR